MTPRPRKADHCAHWAALPANSECRDYDSSLEHFQPTNGDDSSRVAYAASVSADGDDAAAGEKVNVRKIDDNTWEIDLPAWFKAEAPKARKSA